ncbi:MAG: HlyD family efflux transporter periplasmic adaptor subunit [Pseudomonadota bacterium]
MKRKQVGIVVAVLVVSLLAAGMWWFRQAGPTAPMYKTAQLERGTLQATVSATGILNPVRQVQISSQVSGQIKELLVDFNSQVREGQLIARLDPETFASRVRQATADVAAVQASLLTAQANVQQALAQTSKVQVDLEEAERDWQRKQDLVARSFIAASEADRARALVRSQTEALKAAQAQVAVARAQVQNAQAVVRQREAVLQQAQVDVRRTEIRSPVDGIVIKRTVEVGQTVAASLQAPELFVIARNLQEMQVEASIDEADVSRVRQGQKASFTIDAFAGRNFEGEVRQVRQAALNVQNVTTYTVVIAFTNSGGVQPLPGMTANVRIVTDLREDALTVPNAALRVRLSGVEPAAEPVSSTAALSPAQRGRVFLLVLDAKGRPQPRAYNVRLGISDGLATELLPVAASLPAELQDGATVVVGLAAPGTATAPTGGPRSPF